MSQVGGEKFKIAIDDCLRDMWKVYQSNPVVAVRGQGFIKKLHKTIRNELERRLCKSAVARGIRVGEEITIYGSYKAKDVDIAIYDPYSGPLVLVGVRSQMSSIGKNVLTYYQDIAGEAVSLQARFPMAVTAYAYLHPLNYFDKNSKKSTDYIRYARLYAALSGRDDKMYRHISGIYDHFAYMLVDFDKKTPKVCDHLVVDATDVDLSIYTLVDRIVDTVKRRTVWLDLFD